RRGDARGARLRAPCAVAAAEPQKACGRMPTQQTSIQEKTSRIQRNKPQSKKKRRESNATNLDPRKNAAYANATNPDPKKHRAYANTSPKTKKPTITGRLPAGTITHPPNNGYRFAA
ncbi:hypothetical protein, partial [Chimaeribacter coloradensis]|uniref:hypothetical protein n=1 Tax=Chimaeribacter coloradensis TaxID=2060068 RepID=UPI0019D4332E